MRIEHFAIQVADPIAVAQWYVAHCGMTIRLGKTESPFMHFLADSHGNVMLEIYNNPRLPVPDYAAMDHLQVHLAFVSENPHADRERLEKAGATFVEEVGNNGNCLIMMRDPWGFAIHLSKRGTRLLP